MYTSTNLKESMNDILKTVEESGPMLLTVAGGLSLVASIGLTVRATVKAVETIQAHQEELDKAPSKARRVFEVVRLTWKDFVPVVLTGGLSVGCFIEANQISLKRATTTIATCAIVGDKAKEIAEERRPKLPDKERSAKETTDQVVVNGEKCLCLDLFSGRIFETSQAKILSAETTLNKLIACELNVTVNDLYDELGLDNLDVVGNDYGWSFEHDGTITISIGSTVHEKYGPIMTIDYQPRYCGFQE